MFGSYDATGKVDKFPDLEAYYWEEGELKNDNVLQMQNFSDEERASGHGELSTSWGMLQSVSFVARQFFPGQGSHLGPGSHLDHIRSIPEAMESPFPIPY